MGRTALLAVVLALACGVAAASAGGPYRNGEVAYAVCCSKTGIYVIKPDGTGEQRIFAPANDDAPLDPAWSPDGTQIAFVNDGVWLMSATGKHVRRISKAIGDPVFPTWSPNGKQIAFADESKPDSDDYCIFVISATGTGLKRLTPPGDGVDHPAWAPNGGAIVYQRGRDLWTMKPDGSGEHLLVRDAISPSWSPAGTHIAFVRKGDPWVMARNGSGAKKVAHTAVTDEGVAWSPDGLWLVTSPIDRGDLTLVRADGSQNRPLTDASGLFHGWPSWQRTQ